MRPAQQSFAPDVWIVREQARKNLQKSLSYKSIRTWSFDRNRFAEANPIRSFFFIPERERYSSMSTKLYVGNLAFQTTSQELQEMFASAGTVESASVVEDRETGRSRGFAFVEMSTNEEAAAAIEQFNGKAIGGRSLKVNEAKPREPRSGGGGRGFGGGRSNGGNSRGGFGGGGHREPRW